MDIQKESRSPEKYNHEEAEQLAANTAKDLALKISLRNNIKDTKDFSIKVQKLDASEIRQIDKSLSKDLSPGPSK